MKAFKELKIKRTENKRYLYGFKVNISKNAKSKYLIETKERNNKFVASKINILQNSIHEQMLNKIY